MSAIVSLTSLTNRKHKRSVFKEVRKFEPELQLIVDGFVSSVFLYPSHVSYDEIYAFYHAKWIAQVSKFLRSESHEIALDVKFFENNYKSKI